MVPTITCERLTLQATELTDVAVLNRTLRTPPPLEGFPEGACTIGELARWLREVRSRDVKIWTIFHGGDPIGLMTARLEHDAIAQIGFYVEESRHGDGLTTEAVRGLVRWLFTATPVHRVALRVTTSNVTMWRVAQRIGFVLEGVSRANFRWAGGWHDARNYGIIRSDWQAEMLRHQRGGQRAFVPTTQRSA